MKSGICGGKILWSLVMLCFVECNAAAVVQGGPEQRRPTHILFVIFYLKDAGKNIF